MDQVDKPQTNMDNNKKKPLNKNFQKMNKIKTMLLKKFLKDQFT